MLAFQPLISFVTWLLRKVLSDKVTQATEIYSGANCTKKLEIFLDFFAVLKSTKISQRLLHQMNLDLMCDSKKKKKNGFLVSA